MSWVEVKFEGHVWIDDKRVVEDDHERDSAASLARGDFGRAFPGNECSFRLAEGPDVQPSISCDCREREPKHLRLYNAGDRMRPDWVKACDACDPKGET